MTIPQGGEFAFVLFSAAAGAGGHGRRSREFKGRRRHVDGGNAARGYPLRGRSGAPHQHHRRRRGRVAGRAEERDHHRLLAASGRSWRSLLHAQGIGITAVDHDPERIQIAAKYCNKVYFGDVRRADVLAAAGAGKARPIFICVDDPEACNAGISHVRAAFPKAQILARAFDRNHVLQLMQMDVDYFLRETFESSVAMGKEGLRRLGLDPAKVEDIEQWNSGAAIRERPSIQQAEGEFAGVEKVFARYDEAASQKRSNPGALPVQMLTEEDTGS